MSDPDFVSFTVRVVTSVDQALQLKQTISKDREVTTEVSTNVEIKRTIEKEAEL